MTERHQHAPPITDDRLLDDASAFDLAEQFKLLSDPHRLRIIYALVEGGEMCVGAIAELVGTSESATSHQLRNLRLAGFAKSRRDGREIFYSVADSHVHVLLDVAVEHYLHNHKD
ncbi:MAG: metalloregulator ArsR/SmtB family transcription factor [Actinomycetia bacterium]|nr:metalloregulator ArsR/SmtB family transcription factor [Actinomycetes bacterium]